MFDFLPARRGGGIHPYVQLKHRYMYYQVREASAKYHKSRLSAADPEVQYEGMHHQHHPHHENGRHASAAGLHRKGSETHSVMVMLPASLADWGLMMILGEERNF